jgi:hypothetical protein
LSPYIVVEELDCIFCKSSTAISVVVPSLTILRRAYSYTLEKRSLLLLEHILNIEDAGTCNKGCSGCDGLHDFDTLNVLEAGAKQFTPWREIRPIIRRRSIVSMCFNNVSLLDIVLCSFHVTLPSTVVTCLIICLVRCKRSIKNTYAAL